MTSNLYDYIGKSRTRHRRVFHTGTTAILKGIGVAYDMDRGTAADVEGERGNFVEAISTTNHREFAGVTIQAYAANAAGQMITICEPGGICEVAVCRDTTVNVTRLGCIASSIGIGHFTSDAGFVGRGGAIALQTQASGSLAEDFDDVATIGTDKITLTDAGGDYVNAAVAAGDIVYIFGGEDDGTTTIVPIETTVASVTSATVLILTDAAQDVVTTSSIVFYSIISATNRPMCLAYLKTM